MEERKPVKQRDLVIFRQRPGRGRIFTLFCQAAEKIIKERSS
ncbi:MAG: hypothetical protein ACOX5W_12230 [Bacillota bacterium]